MLGGTRGQRCPLVRESAMALYYDLNVFKDVYRLILKMVEDTQGFPREEKYTLGQDMK